MTSLTVTLNDIDSIRALLKPVNGIAVDNTVAYLFDPALFEAYVELARKWAIGTIIEQPLGSSKYWAEQAAASAISINPTNLVHITGTETITGIKTFSETILGNILTATSAGTLTTAINIAISGMATGTATSFDGSADISIPITAIQSASAIQAGVVDTADQTIAGVKTFSSSPIVPSPTTDYQAATKKYVDDIATPSPIATIIMSILSTAPTSYLYCNGAAISRTTYADLFASIGTTYGVGDGSTTFNLPDFRGRFLRGYDGARSAEVGVGQEDGLPNIVGGFDIQGVTSDALSLYRNPTGAFRTNTTVTGSLYQLSSLTSIAYYKALFAASYSNSIYGASSYVTPYNHAVYYYIKY